MRVIGVDVTAVGLTWIALDGTDEICTIHVLAPSKLSRPEAEKGDIENLLALQANVVSALSNANADFIAVIMATADCSVARVKNETMIQLAAKQLALDCVLVPPQSVSAAEKRRLEATANPETRSRIENINPKYLRRSALAAWCVLNGKR